MYTFRDYVSRAALFANNSLFTGRKRLATLMIYATDLCDSGCKHCLIWAKRPVKHLSKAKIIEIMESKCVTRQTTVGLEGGEFLLHPQAFDILQWFYMHHSNFDLLSNCLKPDRLIDAVRRYPPQRLYISLDGGRETYRYMRGKDGYDRVVRVIETLKDTVPISVMFTLSPYNDFDDMKHVAEVCKAYNVDLRIGVYNNIAFFDTLDKAHETAIGTKKEETVLQFKDVRETREASPPSDGLQLPVLTTVDLAQPPHHALHEHNTAFKENIPPIVKDFNENFDFLVLYDEWRKKNLKLRCHSILDSLIVLPNGDVPLCQNLDLKLGNVHDASLEEIFNSDEARRLQHHYSHNCNQCWINFHRKYDIVLYRSLERFFPQALISKMFGYYQWSDDRKATYAHVMEQAEALLATDATTVRQPSRQTAPHPDKQPVDRSGRRQGKRRRTSSSKA